MPAPAKRRRGALFASALLFASWAVFGLSCKGTRPRGESAGGEITVAAAANLTNVFQQIGPMFQAQTGIHPVFSFASTAQLTTQIENLAPFDVFAAADAQHIEELNQKNLLAPGTKAVYAIGVLALWVPEKSAAVTRLEDLSSPAVRTIAIARPELAPYGRAAVETLHALGLWDKVEPKIVYAENINMAKQYGASRNADAVFTAYSLVMKESGRVIAVDDALHRPITQELGIMASSRRQEAARKFVAFLIEGDGRAVLSKNGYRLPPGSGKN